MLLLLHLALSDADTDFVCYDVRRNQRQKASALYAQMSCWPTLANPRLAPALIFVTLDPGYFDYQVLSEKCMAALACHALSECW